jgi:metallophosphoesterase superfamily enzyme
VLDRYNVEIGDGPEQALWKHYGVKPKTSQLFIMPSFNDFLGGRPLNEKGFTEKLESKRVVGPVLRSEAVDLKNAEIYLLDGTFLGALGPLASLA